MPRRSRLQPHLDLLGKIPDQVLAERCGISLASVRAYRYRHRIKLSKSAALTTRANINTADVSLWAFRLTLHQGNQEIDLVVTGRNIQEAAELSLGPLRKRYPEAVVGRIVALAPVLA